MAIRRTFSIIKPDAVAKERHRRHRVAFRTAGLKVIASRMAHLSKAEAEGFYADAQGPPFFNDLVSFMISGPVVLQVLEGERDPENRDLMGATDPKKAAPGTIRADFADSIDANAVHGSDAPETAAVGSPTSSRKARFFALTRERTNDEMTNDELREAPAIRSRRIPSFVLRLRHWPKAKIVMQNLLELNQPALAQFSPNSAKSLPA